MTKIFARIFSLEKIGLMTILKSSIESMITFTPEKLHARLAAMQGRRIAVLGDFMLDRYLWGSVNRISPEAPVPIVEIDTETEQLGGAANVANNIAALGALPHPLGVIGQDGSGARLLDLLESAGFPSAGVFVDSSRPTTIKTRVIAHSQHVVRTDRESRKDLAPELQKQLLDHLKKILPTLDAILIEDYNKGVIAQPLLTHVIALARERQVIITVDPKFNHFFDYQHVTVFKPNRKETEEVLGMKLVSATHIDHAGEILLQRLQCENVLLTLGEQGMALFRKGGERHVIPTRARRVHDVSGAGDTVIATLTVALASGADILEAATLANYAAGVVVGEVGAVPIDREKLIEAITHHQAGDTGNWPPDTKD
ncbi:MAG: D-glycero-beta-D-manno-heptose-7-phosphate kinase [candidate division KSB1 bacterium]|nr:D-glycero-beta-D-manno-heptose-7-phosphate kinase [candidate division KSB1 bacterium]MDZ7302739.1 D-glycero-beta-D-manno-heptose-7-phosphate kinase [candidate division KSB1 bacterium]MDZ7310092.1 D-glycero-beta-D-manno-heptose-7-phosphate kinase [candidate division KSB1 bacterium]